jgi:hypothetical protein
MGKLFGESYHAHIGGVAGGAGVKRVDDDDDVFYLSKVPRRAFAVKFQFKFSSVSPMYQQHCCLVFEGPG